ncbi:MAG: hypothetical protein PHC61_15400, partial [Chitinivibrionales bacterium]|nr:hypothetical protein [Chitinivibrionales bacterium]
MKRSCTKDLFLFVTSALLYLQSGPACAAAAWSDTTPTTTWYATHGSSQTAAAEAMGAGRLTFVAAGSWYSQTNAIPGAANTGADIFSGQGAFSFGVSPFFDIFASGAAFGTSGYTGSPT